MGIFDWLTVDIDWHDRNSLRRNLLMDNIRRGRILAMVIIPVEAILMGAAMISIYWFPDERFAYAHYIAMYFLMIIINLFFLIGTNSFKPGAEVSLGDMGHLENLLMSFISLLMIWGSMISLMDQHLYGSLMTFTVVMITCSVIYYLSNRQILIPLGASFLALSLGLPLFQSSSDILVGHYVNIVIFTALSWIASRMMYLNYCRDFKYKLLLHRVNLQLENEARDNLMKSYRLAELNKQLEQLSLSDDLTGIPNRRSFRNYIDYAFECGFHLKGSFSLIMIDVDFFKQYNDTFGHQAGDAALAAIAETINNAVVRPEHFAARWGGEEFIFASFGAGQREIIKIAEKIRLDVMALHITHSGRGVNGLVSVSQGTATMTLKSPSQVSAVLAMADQALYQAKTDGRNCVRSVAQES